MMIKWLCFVALIALALAQDVAITELGIPIRDKVADGQYKYYTIDTNLILGNLTQDDMVLSFALTAYAGDADLFISKTANPVAPCADCILQGSSPRGEVKTVKRTDPEWPGKSLLRLN